MGLFTVTLVMLLMIRGTYMQCTSPFCSEDKNQTQAWHIIDQFLGYQRDINNQCLHRTDVVEKALAAANSHNEALATHLEVMQQLLTQTVNKVAELSEVLFETAILSCTSTSSSGVYILRENDQLHPVYCDSIDGGGWMTIVKRQNGDVAFNRTWAEYVSGFGLPSNEYWLGLDLLHSLTTKEPHELRLDISDFDGTTAYAKYSTFSVGAASSGYTLTVSGSSGTANVESRFGGDALLESNGEQFSTQDTGPHFDCTRSRGKGGWWYKTCHWSQPTGLYHQRSEAGEVHMDGINWWHWKGDFRSFQTMSLKMRPRLDIPTPTIAPPVGHRMVL